jgi:NAD+ synthase (glutamine-hydrolysing)
MPSRYTASISLEDAKQQLQILGVNSSIFSIEAPFEIFLKTLAPAFADAPPDITEENLQARIRGILLMALSNKKGDLVLTTSNKSETAVGYTTLYGDMVGGFAPLQDVLKTQVYALARYRNSLSAVIPERVLTRPPSAELAENQTDQDSLPDYDIVDAIIKAYIEKNQSAEDIIRTGYSSLEVNKVIQLINRNEYKRHQAAPGIKISPRAFGRDWRYPITSGFF